VPAVAEPIAVVMGGLFTTGALWSGATLYRALGGAGGALAVALAYSNVVFAGASTFWVFNILASVVRAPGTCSCPRRRGGWGRRASRPLAGADRRLGAPPAPGDRGRGRGPGGLLDRAGSLVLLGYLAAGRGFVRLLIAGLRIRWRLLSDILRLGLPGSLNTIQANLTVVLLAGLVRPFGTFALAGYGMGVRLAGRVLWPLVAGFARLLTAALGGWLAIHSLGGGPSGLFLAIALSLVVSGTTVAVAIRAGAWSRAPIPKTPAEVARHAAGTRWRR
jgi:MATE family, multidrug efflux pump